MTSALATLLFSFCMSLFQPNNGGTTRAGNMFSERFRFYAANTRISADSTETREHLLVSISEFQAEWQQAWRDGEVFRKRTRRAQQIMRLRLPFLHCHNDGRDFGATDGRVGVSKFQDDTVIKNDFLLIEMQSANSRYAVCPTWLMNGAIDQVQDESIARDGALIDTMQASVKKLRARLLTELDSTARLLPNDGWITGQRVRFYMDQEDLPGAVTAAQSCRGEAWWCKALLGYVNGRTTEMWPAESLFVEMRAVMPTTKRCEWEDLSNLLAPGERKTYLALSCDARIATNTKIWWLADPLYRTYVNERFVEHEIRRVELALRQDVGQDERFNWIPKEGGDALAGMLERYGWPMYTAWGGYDDDTSHTSYLDGFNSPTMAPYTTFEYSLGRVHTFPTFATVLDPFNITDSSFTLQKENARGEPATNWWPVEHYRPERAILQLPEGQTAMFRRQSQDVVAVAVRFDHPAIMKDRAAMQDVMLVTTIAPGKLDSLAQAIIKPGATAALRGLVDAKPRIVGVESQGPRNTNPDARSRFSVTPPPPLDSMKRGDLAVSDPALLMLDGDNPLPPPAEELLDRMLGTARLDSKLRRIGVYWETYGLSAMDTVTVYVRVATDERLSTIRRLGISLNVAENPNREVVQRWTEPDAQRGTRTLDGPIPVQMRTIQLNLAQLQPGPYVLEVGVERKDGVTATGRRRIVIEP